MVAQTICIGCGKMRILDKTWSDHIGLANTTYTRNICPDAQCQKEVDALLKDRHDVLTNRLEESKVRRKANMMKGMATRKAKSREKEKELSKKQIHS